MATKEQFKKIYFRLGGGAEAGWGGVASGGMVLSATENAALVSAGYVRIGTVNTGDGWQQRVQEPGPSGRDSPAAVWTGSEMIIRGGTSQVTYNDTWSYTPAGRVLHLYQRP